MTPLRSIVAALKAASSANSPVVLAAVVRVTGSSYGGVGSRMVIGTDGSTVGIVSGGCLESDLAEHARQVHIDGRSKVVSYDTRADDDAAWGLGLGCNGLIDVLLEPMSPSQSGEFAGLMEQALGATSASVIASIIDSPNESKGVTGAHALMIGNSIQTVGDWGDRAALNSAAADLSEARTAGRSGLVSEYDSVHVAFEVLHPALRLVICGSGPDVIPLIRFGAELGWDLTVIDHRPVEHAHAERFPGATVVECADPRELAKAVSITPHTAAVVMSHHFVRDTNYVHALLESNAGYIGVLGPRMRSERMGVEIGNAYSSDGSARLFAPVGLDVGGDGPDAIALSIVAEVSAVMGKRSAGHLRNHDGSLHSPVDA